MNRAVVAAASAVGLSIVGAGCFHGDDEAQTPSSPERFGVDRWVEENDLPEGARRGAEIFAQVGCGTCHTYLDSGVRSLGGSDLTAVGAKPGLDEDFFVRYVSDPAAFGNEAMPGYATMGRDNLEALAVFLESSKGTGG